MTNQIAASSAELPCHVCGYDLRAHPPDANCPECGASVETSRELALIPRRPAWVDSDPRWRRRVLAGVWILALLPLMDVLQVFELDTRIPVPGLFETEHTSRTLDDTLLRTSRLYQPLLFCVGTVLLFSKERGRRRDSWGWTRRWGILCVYATLLLSIAPVLFIGALVLVGIAAIFLSMPLRYQPASTHLCVELSTALLRHTYPKPVTDVVVVAFASIVMLLACAPLFTALRSSGSKRLAAVVVFPLSLFALMHLAQAVRAYATVSFTAMEAVYEYRSYFRPVLFISCIANVHAGRVLSASELIDVAIEAAKWCIVLTIAAWLSIAQFAASRRPPNLP